MSGYKFVEQYGLEEARKLIAFAGPFYLKSFTVKNREIDADQLRQAIADFKLIKEYKLPDDFWPHDGEKDKWGISGTGLYLENFACYSNDEEKSRLDRLQLALDRICEGIKNA
ncbi:hypothetical protein [Acinetobacter puyangensis]|uniref:hypothetical protein n=1 Tax=Acinetobacter puyangensis TaxID=1096779 RepID=UPI003A4DB0D1